MRKLLSIVLMTVLAVSLLTACGAKTEVNNNHASKEKEATKKIVVNRRCQRFISFRLANIFLGVAMLEKYENGYGSIN